MTSKTYKTEKDDYLKGVFFGKLLDHRSKLLPFPESLPRWRASSTTAAPSLPESSVLYTHPPQPPNIMTNPAHKSSAGS